MTRYIIHDDSCSAGLLRAVAAEWPDERWPHWHRYADDSAQKFGIKDGAFLTPAARVVIEKIAEIDVCDALGVRAAAFPDLRCHGAGMHAIPPGGRLGLHLDGARHPLTGWRREATAILFCDAWNPDWGGELELWTEDRSNVETVIVPRFNRLVLFQASDTAWHQVKRVTGSRHRRTLSIFWWSNEASASQRDRALFE